MLSMAERTPISRLSQMTDQRSSAVAEADGNWAMRRPLALLLEDEALISLDVETTLSDAGFEVHNAVSCEDAHNWLDLNRPDVVIVDIVLRDGRCTEVVTRLLQARVPFIVHSGDHRGLHIGTPFEFGEWLNKPSAPTALVLAVNAAADIRSEMENSQRVGERCIL
jgi:DNA-binding response OmpR family regulator